MASRELLISGLGYSLIFVLSVCFAYIIKAGIGYVLWYTKRPIGEDHADLDEISDEIGESATIRVYDNDRIAVTRVSTLTPRWLLTSAAVDSLSAPHQRCLIVHTRSYLRSRSRLLHNSAMGVGFTLVVFAPQVGTVLPTVVQQSLPYPGFLFAIAYFIVCLPLVERWLIYRADRRAAMVCGDETYIGFLEATAESEPQRPFWYSYLEPTPRRRASKLEGRVPTDSQ